MKGRINKKNLIIGKDINHTEEITYVRLNFKKLKLNLRFYFIFYIFFFSIETL